MNTQTNTNRLKYVTWSRLLAGVPVVLLFMAIIVAAKGSTTFAAGNPPSLSLPYASGTPGVSMGISGLHGGNFSGVPGYSYTLSDSQSVTNASLDIGWTNQSSTSYHTIAMASGKVLIGYGNSCNMFTNPISQQTSLRGNM